MWLAFIPVEVVVIRMMTVLRHAVHVGVSLLVEDDVAIAPHDLLETLRVVTA